jgi:hypothetical protein
MRLEKLKIQKIQKFRTYQKYSKYRKYIENTEIHKNAKNAANTKSSPMYNSLNYFFRLFSDCENFELLGFPPGPDRSSLVNLGTLGSPRVSILTPDLVRTPCQHDQTEVGTPDLKPFSNSGIPSSLDYRARHGPQPANSMPKSLIHLYQSRKILKRCENAVRKTENTENSEIQDIPKIQ